MLFIPLEQATVGLLTCLLVVLAIIGLTIPIANAGSTVLPSTADIWLSDATNEERNSSSGKAERFKLKSIQEMAAIRFDITAVANRKVLSAKLFLRKANKNRVRYLRISSIGANWVEGQGKKSYGPPDGSTYLWADFLSKRAWSFPGSEFADVIMGSGHSITTYSEIEDEGDNWISAVLTPELIYTMASNGADGLAIMEGGSDAFFNNYFWSVQSKYW